MSLASNDNLKHLRSLINGMGADKPVSSNKASEFHILLFPHSAIVTPYQIRRYANGEDPMPKNIYEMLVNARLSHCD